ncbi:MAG: helix-turn-helix transcriptional regulator [Rhodomicrobium sp.]|nr:helix-turn-helix transcriptional regulator [Rhodomicrobium sp.]
MQLLAAMRDAEATHWLRSARLDAVKTSTRGELYRRCLRARAYIEEFYASDLPLLSMADVAGLSAAHFLRCFKAAFGETPHQMLRRVRLDRGAALLALGNVSVAEAAVCVGYSDFSAFARAFRRRFGVPPSAFRS